jgi:hypothetical protein
MPLVQIVGLVGRGVAADSPSTVNRRPSTVHRTAPGVASDAPPTPRFARVSFLAQTRLVAKVERERGNIDATG